MSAKRRPLQQFAENQALKWDWNEWSKRSWQRHIGRRVNLDLSLNQQTLPEIALATAEAYPEQLAVSIDGRSHTFRSLTIEALLVSSWLENQIAVGERILLVAPTTLLWVEAYLGVLMAGAIAVLVNPSYSGPELLHMAEDSGAILALSAGNALETCSVLSIPVVDLAERPWHGAAPKYRPRKGFSSTSIALLAYTSGTTGRPKGVPLSHAQLISSIYAAVSAWRWSKNDVVVHSLPLYHQHGLGALHASWCTGSSAALLSRFDCGKLAALARESEATVLFAVPAIYRRLVEDIDTLPRDDLQALSGLRLRICGSAPLDEQLAHDIAAKLGGPALVRYGLTESGLNVSQPYGAPEFGTIGLPLPGVELRLVNNGEEVGPGTEGEIQMRGPQIFKGYWNNPKATSDAIDSEGWFSTGDIAVLDDPEKQLRICGRTKELIITGGLNVYPREVELALESHPRILEAGVAGLVDDLWGEQVTAWVVIKGSEPLSKADLIEHSRRLLAPYKCPKEVYFVKSLPRNQMGKLQRTRLAPPEREPVK